MTEDSEESESESEEDENPLKKKFSATAKVALALGSSSIHSGEEDDLMSPREEAPKKFSKVGSFEKKKKSSPSTCRTSGASKNRDFSSFFFSILCPKFLSDQIKF